MWFKTFIRYTITVNYCTSVKVYTNQKTKLCKPLYFLFFDYEYGSDI